MRRVNHLTATLFDQWMRTYGLDPETATIDEMAEAAPEMKRWLHSVHIRQYSTIQIAFGMLALQNGGEI